MARVPIRLQSYEAYTRLPGPAGTTRRVKTYVPGTLVRLGNTIYKVGKHTELRKVGKP